MKRVLLLLLLVACSAAPRRPAGEEIAQLQERIARLRDTPQLQSGPERCEKLQKIAEEICRCSDRICALAGDLGDEPSRRTCVQSREDCQRARSQQCL